MTNTFSRLGAVALTLAAFLPSVEAQTVADAPSADHAAVPVASVAPASTSDRLLDASLAPKDAQGRHLAPHDTFYLLEYVSVKTDKGVEGFEPGQEVHLVEVHRPTHTLVVSDGRAQVEVEPSKLTNNLDIAAMVRRKDQNSQAQLAAYVQAEQAAYQKSEKEAAEATAKDLDQRNREAVAESRVGSDTPSAQPTPQVAASYSGDGYGYNGYYDNGGYGYGSPYSYFGGNNNGNQAAAAAAAAAAAGAKAPATAPSVGVPVGNGGGKVAAPAGGGSSVGRPK